MVILNGQCRPQNVVVNVQILNIYKYPRIVDMHFKKNN